jgi:hypothetical protein
MVPRKVKNVYLYENNWRYRLAGFENVAYAEAELKPAVEEQELIFIISPCIIIIIFFIVPFTTRIS